MRGAWRKSANSSGAPGGLDGVSEISSAPASPEAIRNPSSSWGGPEQLSEAFCRARRLDYTEILEDGFRDAGGRGLNEACPEGMPLAAAAVVVVDRRSDSALGEFVNRTAKKLVRASDPVTKVMLTSLLVSEALGRSGEHAATVRQRCEQLVVERLDPATGAIHLGAILHEQQQGMPGNLKQRKPGAGTSRHRAVLFKALADWLSIAPCALCRDEAATTWNTVLVEGEPFVVDVMFDPGALYEENSGKASEYLRRLQQESRDSSSSSGTSVPSRRSQSVAAPSVQQNLGGRMLRPSWHVEPWEVEFDRRDRAGRGGFGEVFHGGWAGQMVAVKEVRDASPTDGDICDFILEISLLSRLSHPNVIRFWRGCVDLRGGHRTLLLVTEWMDRGVLSSLLHESQEPNLTFGQTLALAAGIARGIAYLHHVKILHLDLKSPNVLLNSAFQPKLCDFGLAKLREQTSLHTTLRGVSPIWAPPEVFDEQAGGVTEKADVYSFGIVLFELATRKLPYADVSQMSLPRVKARGQLPKFPDDMDADVMEFVKLCLSHRATARPAMHGVVTRIQQLARKRSMDLEAEQARMERHGLHFGGPAGSMPNLEQLRRAEVEKRRAELEVARLRRLLQDEEAKVRAVEEQLLQQNGGAGGEADRQSRIDDFCRTNTQAVGDAKFRCCICRKLFRGTEFVHKHIREKHVAEMLGSPSVAIQSLPAATGQANAANNAGPNAAANDDFFDADVAEESDVRSYTQRISGAETTGTKRFNQALQDAAEAGDASKLQQCLLQGGSGLNQADLDGTTPLQLAARHGHSECVQYMISNTCNVNAANESGLTPLHLAAQEGHSMICELLLQAGSVVDAEGSVKNRTALHLSAANGHREVCTALLLFRAAVDSQDKDGESALHNAARFGDRELCEAILSFGANVGLADNDGWSALHEAARWGDGGLVDSLLQRGADVNARSNDGESPLHVVPGGYAEFEVVEVLLQWRCDANCKDFDGETPLHVAVKLGDVELADVLLKSGADANAANTAAATPLDFARKDEIRWLLRSHKARKGAGAN